VKKLGYRAVHLREQVSLHIQDDYWDGRQLPDRARHFTVRDCKDFIIRKGTKDPYQYGPLPAFLEAYRVAFGLNEGKKGEESDQLEVRFLVLFFFSSDLMFLACLLAVLFVCLAL